LPTVKDYLIKTLVMLVSGFRILIKSVPICVQHTKHSETLHYHSILPRAKNFHCIPGDVPACYHSSLH